MAITTSRTWLWETAAPVKISSRVKTPDRKRPPDQRTGILKLVPHCRLVLVLDGVRFPYSVPLPPEQKAGAVDDADPGLAGRGGKGR